MVEWLAKWPTTDHYLKLNLSDLERFQENQNFQHNMMLLLFLFTVDQIKPMFLSFFSLTWIKRN